MQMEKLEKKTIRLIVAALLITVGLAGMVVWELWGRDTILSKPVLVTAVNIEQGQKITQEKVEVRQVPIDALMSGALKERDTKKIVGQVSKQYIPANSQLSANFAYKDDFYIAPDEALFYIPATWIDSKSTAIRRGDTVEFWTAGAAYKIGEYKIAFVKDDQENEVDSIEGQEYNDTLDRTGATGVGTHVEIIATIAEYKNLYEIATGKQFTEVFPNEDKKNPDIPVVKFLLIQKSEVKN